MADNRFSTFLKTKVDHGSGDLTALTEEDANTLFRRFQERGNAGDKTRIPFNFPKDYCNVRAEEMATDPLVHGYATRGVPFAKIWLATPGHAKKLRAISVHGDLDTPAGNYTVWQRAAGEALPASSVGTRHFDASSLSSACWSWHVALISLMRRYDGQERVVVFDPSVAQGPITPDEWRKLANYGDAYCWPMTVKWYRPDPAQDGPKHDHYTWITVDQATTSGMLRSETKIAQDQGNQQGWREGVRPLSEGLKAFDAFLGNLRNWHW
jgi:hypothetical protein